MAPWNETLQHGREPTVVDVVVVVRVEVKGKVRSVCCRATRAQKVIETAVTLGRHGDISSSFYAFPSAGVRERQP